MLATPSSVQTVQHADATVSTENADVELPMEFIDAIGVQRCPSNITATQPNNKGLSDITMPPRIRKTGRPKDSELTVIGLQKKRARNTQKPFNDLSTEEKNKIMLRWFVSEDTYKDCMELSYTVTVSDITCTLSTVHLAATEQDLETVKCYFESKAWKKVYSTIKGAKKRDWTCRICDKTLDPVAVGCDRSKHVDIMVDCSAFCFTINSF